jgi:hypothetical protein
MDVITYDTVFMRFAMAITPDETGRRGNYLDYAVDGSPTIYLAHVREDCDIVCPVSSALATYGVDINAEWCAARLFDDFDEDAALRLSVKLGHRDAWLVAVVSERARHIERLTWALDLARKTMPPNRYAFLPVRYGPGFWVLPQAILDYPRLELRGDDLGRIMPDSFYFLPLRRWLRPAA